MVLDGSTLAVVSVFVTTILGSLLLFAWLQDRSIAALAWWGSAYLLGAWGVALLAGRGAIPDFLSIEVGNALLMVAYASVWTGARLFGGRKTWPGLFFVAPIFWVSACQLPVFATDINARVILSSFLMGSLAAGTVYELWRDRHDKLLSRWPAIAVIAVHSLFLFARTPLVLIAPLPDNPMAFRSSAFAIIALGGTLYTIIAAFLFLAMTKERAEQRHKRAAQLDSLTGIANRRAFLEQADRHLQRSTRSSAPIAILLFDLDRFKEINDRFGHGVGDRVLCLFSDVMTSSLRPGDLVGRLGGEEFAALLPGSDLEQARIAAERVRASFADAAAVIGDQPVKATVSVGVRIAHDVDAKLDLLIATADAALYRAKAKGRDRVEVVGVSTKLVTQMPPTAQPDPVHERSVAVARRH